MRLSYRVFTVHAICKTQPLYIHRDIQHKSRYTHAIYVEISMLQFNTLLNIAKRVLKTRFGNKLGTNATRFLNHVFNISESRFDSYPVRRHDCMYRTIHHNY